MIPGNSSQSEIKSTSKKVIIRLKTLGSSKKTPSTSKKEEDSNDTCWLSHFKWSIVASFEAQLSVEKMVAFFCVDRRVQGTRAFFAEDWELLARELFNSALQVSVLFLKMVPFL